MSDVIVRYKVKVIIFTTQIGTSVTEDKFVPIPINDDGINRVFGWAVFKLKKKYSKMTAISRVNPQVEGKQKLLDGMSYAIQDVIQNISYLRIYYQLDDEIRNKWYLTLVTPIYIAGM